MKNERGDSNSRYVCLDRRVGKNLYGFYNHALAEREEHEFEEHLLFCFHCQEKILTLDMIFNALKGGETLFQPRREVGTARLSSGQVETD